MGGVAYRAIQDVHHGIEGVIHAGELVPETFKNIFGELEDHDFERLLGIGAVQDAELPYPPDSEGAPAGAPPVSDAPPADPAAPPTLESLTVDALKAIAAEEKVALDGLKKKAEIVVAIATARAAAAEQPPADPATPAA